MFLLIRMFSVLFLGVSERVWFFWVREGDFQGFFSKVFRLFLFPSKVSCCFPRSPGLICVLFVRWLFGFLDCSVSCKVFSGFSDFSLGPRGAGAMTKGRIEWLRAQLDCEGGMREEVGASCDWVAHLSSVLPSRRVSDQSRAQSTN